MLSRSYHLNLFLGTFFTALGLYLIFGLEGRNYLLSFLGIVLIYAGAVGTLGTITTAREIHSRLPRSRGVPPWIVLWLIVLLVARAVQVTSS
jgi:hypothetical protein